MAGSRVQVYRSCEFGIVKNINISNQGEFYETPPVILLNGGGGSGGKAKATVNLGAITNVRLLILVVVILVTHRLSLLEILT